MVQVLIRRMKGESIEFRLTSERFSKRAFEKYEAEYYGTAVLLTLLIPRALALGSTSKHLRHLGQLQLFYCTCGPATFVRSGYMESSVV